MGTYRIVTSRNDVPPEIYKEFGAANDGEAKRELTKARENPSNEWDHLQLFEVVQTEKTRIVDSSPVPGANRP